MNSKGRFNQCDILQPTIFSPLSLPAWGCFVMLSWILSHFSLSSKKMIALLNVLMPVVVDRLISWQNGLMLEEFIFFSLKYIYKCKVSVASLHFRFSNLFKLLLLQSWMLGFILICASFDNFFVVLIAHTRKAKVSFILISFVKDNLCVLRGTKCH